MFELGGELGLALETGGEFAVTTQLAGEDLDGDLAFESDVVRQKDRAHAALAELGLDTPLALEDIAHADLAETWVLDLGDDGGATVLAEAALAADGFLTLGTVHLGLTFARDKLNNGDKSPRVAAFGGHRQASRPCPRARNTSTFRYKGRAF